MLDSWAASKLGKSNMRQINQQSPFSKARNSTEKIASPKKQFWHEFYPRLLIGSAISI
jgi:hypothetical protein